MKNLISAAVLGITELVSMESKLSLAQGECVQGTRVAISGTIDTIHRDSANNVLISLKEPLPAAGNCIIEALLSSMPVPSGCFAGRRVTASGTTEPGIADEWLNVNSIRCN